MKHVMPVGLVVLAGALLWALMGAGSAMGAANFCTVQESPCLETNLWATGITLDFTLKSGTKAKLANTAGETLEECTSSTLKGKLEKVESATTSIESLTWGTCNFPTTTTELGTIEVENAATAHNGTVKAEGETKITMNGGFFGSCIYGFSSKIDLGELKEGKPATLVVNAVAEKKEGSAVACPETSKWTAEYTLTEPSEKTLSVENGTAALPGTVFCTVQEEHCKEANRWAAGTTLDANLKTKTKALLVEIERPKENLPIVECGESTAKGKITNAGGSGKKVTGELSTLTWGKCTSFFEEIPTETKTTQLGKIEVETAATAHNGTVKADSETKVTVNAILYGTCIYGATAGTDLGELKEGKPATFVASAVLEKQSGSNFACPKTAKWTAEYTLTEPAEKTLSVETS